MVTFSLDEDETPKSNLAKTLEVRMSESESDIITHLVGEKITIGMIQDLHLPREVKVKTHGSICDAVSAAEEGDIILLFPGIHSASGLANFYFGLTFIGVGKAEETIISCCGLTDALDLSGTRVSFQNIKFYDEQCSWLLSSSNTESFDATNCIFEGGGVQLYGNGEMKLDECEVFGALAYGVCILSGSKASLQRCNIHNNGSSTGEDCGLLIEVDTKDYMDTTKIDLVENKIHNNQGPGILLVDAEEGKKLYEEGSLEDLDAVTNLKASLESNSILNNTGGQIKCSTKLGLRPQGTTED